MWPFYKFRVTKTSPESDVEFLANNFLFSCCFSARSKDEEWRILEKDKFVNDYDRDKDGRLDSEEVMHWMAPDDG